MIWMQKPQHISNTNKKRSRLLHATDMQRNKIRWILPLPMTIMNCSQIRYCHIALENSHIFTNNFVLCRRWNWFTTKTQDPYFCHHTILEIWNRQGYSCEIHPHINLHMCKISIWILCFPCGISSLTSYHIWKPHLMTSNHRVPLLVYIQCH